MVILIKVVVSMKIQSEVKRNVQQTKTVRQIYFVMINLALVLAQIYFVDLMLSVNQKIMQVIEQLKLILNSIN